MYMSPDHVGLIEMLTTSSLIILALEEGPDIARTSTRQLSQ